MGVQVPLPAPAQNQRLSSERSLTWFGISPPGSRLRCARLTPAERLKFKSPSRHQLSVLPETSERIDHDCGQGIAVALGQQLVAGGFDLDDLGAGRDQLEGGGQFL